MKHIRNLRELSKNTIDWNLNLKFERINHQSFFFLVMNQYLITFFGIEYDEALIKNWMKLLHHLPFKNKNLQNQALIISRKDFQGLYFHYYGGWCIFYVLLDHSEISCNIWSNFFPLVVSPAIQYIQIVKSRAVV